MVARLLLGVRGLSCSSLMRHLDEARQDAVGAEEPPAARPGTAALPALGGPRAQRTYEPSPWAS